MIGRISQAFVSTALNSFRERFLAKYGLQPYKDERKPALFFGCYTYKRPDIDIVKKHKNLAVVVWGGSDAMSIKLNRYHPVLYGPNVRHVAISRFISEDLSEMGVSHWYLPVTPSTVRQFEPCPLGDMVYVYSAHSAPQKYGEAIANQVAKKVPGVKFLFRYANPPGHTPNDQIQDDYAKCFCALRLTRHDGLSNTVVEMGLMGRRCVWNGWLSNAVPWSGIDGIAKFINREKEKIGKMYPAISEAVKRDLELPANWLDTEFYL